MMRFTYPLPSMKYSPIMKYPSINLVVIKGFTLLELMVAMLIFALLALSGWQVFSGLNQANERAGVHVDNLSELQYAYLQIQNDINQVVAWSSVTGQPITPSNTADTTQYIDKNKVTTETQFNFFQLTPESVSFIRFADPDPRYQTSPTIVRVEYHLTADSLVRRQSQAVDGVRGLDNSGFSDNSFTGTESVLLANVSNLSFQALLPEAVTNFTSIDANSSANHSSNSSPTGSNQAEKPLLPKAVAINFDYNEEPIQWRLALPKTAPKLLVEGE